MSAVLLKEVQSKKEDNDDEEREKMTLLSSDLIGSKDDDKKGMGNLPIPIICAWWIRDDKEKPEGQKRGTRDDKK